VAAVRVRRRLGRGRFRGDGGGAEPGGGVGGQQAVVEGAAGQEDGGVGGQGDRGGREVGHAGQVAAAEGEHPGGRGQPVQGPVAEGGLGAAEPQRGAVQLEHRVRVAGLQLDGQLAPLLGLGQPRRGGGGVGWAGCAGGRAGWAGCAGGRREAERRLQARPGQRDPAAVPAGVGAAGAVPDRVLAAFVRDVLDLPQAQLLALVQVDRAG
jgi:hypothetical protein